MASMKSLTRVLSLALLPGLDIAGEVAENADAIQAGGYYVDAKHVLGIGLAYQKADSKLRASVAIHLEGVSPAVKDFSGVVVNNLSEVEVESLPQYLPERIVVNIGQLKEIGDTIYVRDLVVPSEVTILQDMDEVVVNVSVTRAEIEEEEVAEEEISEPEVIERGKKEEEEEE